MSNACRSLWREVLRVSLRDACDTYRKSKGLRLSAINYWLNDVHQEDRRMLCELADVQEENVRVWVREVALQAPKLGMEALKKTDKKYLDEIRTLCDQG